MGSVKRPLNGDVSSGKIPNQKELEKELSEYLSKKYKILTMNSVRLLRSSLGQESHCFQYIHWFLGFQGPYSTKVLY